MWTDHRLVRNIVCDILFKELAFFFFLRQGLIYLRLASHLHVADELESSCFYLPSVGIPGVLHHTWSVKCWDHTQRLVQAR